MNTKERIIFALQHPTSVGQVIGSVAERYLHLPKFTYPYVLQIHLDSICNMKCFFCAYEGRNDKPQKFDINNLKKLEKAIKHCNYLALSAWGEPLCSPNFEAVLETIYSWNNQSGLIALVTNGSELSPRIAKLLTGHLADLTVSLDFALPSSYNSNKQNGNWEKTIMAVKSFMQVLAYQERKRVNLHLVAYRDNILELCQFVEIAKMLEIERVAIDQFTVNTITNMPLSLIHSKEKYNTEVEKATDLAKLLGISFSARRFGVERSSKSCYFPWIFADIWADGRVAPCCCNGAFFLGNAYETSFEDVWFGKAYQAFRRWGASICASCPMVLPFDDPNAHISPYLIEVLNENTTCN